MLQLINQKDKEIGGKKLVKSKKGQNNRSRSQLIIDKLDPYPNNHDEFELMSVSKAILVLASQLLMSNVLFSQEIITKPLHFTVWNGKVYKMPIVTQKRNRLIKKGIIENYHVDIKNYQELQSITLNELNIQETEIGKGSFPGISETERFCMLLHSKLHIEQKGFYSFSLTSDDGSILWIEDEVIVDNDGGHPMEKKMDTTYLEQGTYDAKVWYFQGLPNKFGLVLENDVVEGKNLNISRHFDITNDMFFESESATLDSTGISHILSIVDSLNVNHIVSVEIIGHTDNQGSEAFNMALSIERARAVADIMGDSDVLNDIPIKVFGKGKSDPVADNSTEEGRALNRRVELLIKMIVLE